MTDNTLKNQIVVINPELVHTGSIPNCTITDIHDVDGEKFGTWDKKTVVYIENTEWGLLW